MVNGAGCIEQDHADNKYGKSQYMRFVRFCGSLDDEWGSGAQSQDHGDKMSQGTARIFDFQSHDDSSFRKCDEQKDTCSFENYIKLFYILYSGAAKNAIDFPEKL